MLHLFAATVALSALSSPDVRQSPSPAATATPNPDVLFTRARAALGRRAYPRAVTYDVAVETTAEGGEHKLNHYRTAFRANTGTIAAHVISDEQAADTSKPQGINFAIAGITLNKPDSDGLGIPRLAPTYTFGLVPYAPILPTTGLSATQALPVEGATPLTPSADANAAFPFAIGEGGTLPIAPSGGFTAAPAPGAAPSDASLRQIGKVSTTFKIYDVSYVGEVKIGDVTTWHLRLKPRLNPGRYRVRDLYIDESNDETVRIRTEGNFTLKNLGCYWDVDFAKIDGHWYIVRETADQPVDGFDSIVVTFSNYREITKADENLVFGVSGSVQSDILEEP
jgi:hypothetical protein